MSARDKRERRQSAARKRAETHSTGFSTTLLRMPEGVSFFETEKGIREVDIVPFIAGKGNPFAEVGELYFERTFWCWRYIGAEEKTYACLHKTFGKKDPVQEWKNEESKNPNADQKYLKDLSPKERQLFLVWDHADKTKLQIWEVSHHLFGKLLDSRIKNSPERLGWDQFYFPDEDGMSLRLTFEEQSGGGFTWLDVTAIDFIPRDEALPDKIQNHGICLDDIIVETSYNELRQVFLQVDEEGEGRPAKKDEKKEEKKEERTEKVETKKEEPKTETKKAVTAEDLGITKGDEVVHDKVLCTVVKIAEDGTLTLMDSNDDIIKGVDPSNVKIPKTEKVETKKEEPKKETKKEEPKAETKKEKPTESDEDAEGGDDDWDF